MTEPVRSEAERLEKLWSGEFGDEYVERNRAAGERRGPFWQEILSTYQPRRVLEVGCNVGANLRWIAPQISPHCVYGVDVNRKALEEARRSLPGVNTLWSPARSLPFRDSWFDLVLTMGVLIHQPPETLPLVMSETVRCSRRYVLCGEYFADKPTEKPYRGERGALFKQDFGGLYQRLFPELQLRETRLLPKSEGWDDVTFWVFEKELI